MSIERPIKRTPEEQALRGRLLHLLTSNMKLVDIAALMGAEKFVSTYTVRGETYRTFQHDAFIHSALAKDRAVPAEVVQVDGVLLPPGPGEITPGSGPGIERGNEPRTVYLLEVLKELGIEDFVCVRGTVNPEMFRKIGYVLFVLKQLHKGVFVCDELENATFVVHDFDPEQWETWIQKTKDELRQMPVEKVTPVNFLSKERWKERMKEILTADPGTIKPPKPQAPDSEVAQREVAENGWIWIKAHEFYLTIEGNGQTIRISRQRQLQLIDQCRKVHPDWVGFFVPRNAAQRKKYLHISPDGLEYIQELTEKYPPAPAGWVTEHQIRKATRLHIQTIKRRCAHYRISNPEWFVKFTNSGGMIVEYLSPEMQAILYEQNGTLEFAPEGWYTLEQIEHLIGRTEFVIAPLLTVAVDQFPGSYKVYRGKNGRQIMHYTMEVVGWVKEELAKRKPAQPGWMTEYAMAQQLGRTRKWIQARIQQYLGMHHDAAEMQETLDGRYLLHYNPEVVNHLQQLTI